jgi:hypothetical protein
MPAMADRPTSGAFPNLIVIGAMKCGTTSLHHYLDLHPEIQMSTPKELAFFAADRNWGRGVDWYMAHFTPEAPVRGESSPQYTNHPARVGVAERMSVLLPDARLIYMVRDPIERMISEYLHRSATGEERRPIAQALHDRRYLDPSRYRVQLDRYLRHYPRDRIHVADAEDLRHRRESTLRAIFGFLGVDASFTSPGFERLWEATAGKNRKYALLQRARRLPVLRSTGRLPQGARWALERVKYSTVGGRVERPRLDDALRDELLAELGDDAMGIREFAGREFAGWSV